MLLTSLAAALAVAVASGETTQKSFPSPAQQPTIHLSGAQMLALGEYLQSRGSKAEASRIYELLAKDADTDIRNEARFRQARILAGDGNLKRAAILLRQVIDDRPEAAPPRLVLAQLLERMGEQDAALRELRAAQASGLPPAVARMVDRYSQALRASRPIGASLEIALAPDSNINHATRSDTLGTIFGDFDIGKGSKAASGIGLSLHGQAFRRFAIGADNAFLIRLSSLADLYSKGEFNDIVVDLGAGPELRLDRSQLNLELGATQRWFGQKPYMRSVRLGATWTRPVTSTTQLRLTGVASLVDNRFNDLEDGKTFTGRAAVEHALTATTGVGLNGSLMRESLRDPGYSTKGWRLGLLGWHDVGRATVTAEAEIGRLNADDRLALFPEKRSDRYSRLSAGVTLRQLQFQGFAPVVRFTIERNRSSIEFYDYRRRRTEFGVVRAF
jgi:tetratricopeptide (TPR) repeat protein